MNLKIVSIGFCTLVLVAACTSTPSGGVDHTRSKLASASSNVSEGQVESPKDQMICKVRPITGSRFKQKTCMTAQEWKNMAEGSKDMVNAASRTSVQGNPDGG